METILTKQDTLKLYVGMIIENDAEGYTYKKGLFELRQNGSVVEIVNGNNFKPKEWTAKY